MISRLLTSTKTLQFTFILIIVLIFTVDIQTLSASDTKISTSRNPNRANICNYYTASYTLQQRQKSKTKVQQYTYMTDAQIQSLLFNNKYQYSTPLTLVMTLPHLISLAVLFMLILPLCCCCTWPQKYPICKTWRKPQNQMYTKCQLKWPAYFSLVLYVIVCVGGLIAIIQAPLIIKKYNDVGCKYAAIFDDLLYGRLSPTVEGRFYVGLEPLRNQLNIFNGTKISTFYSDSANALSTATQVRTKQQLVQTTVQTTYSGYINSVYSNAFVGSNGVAYYDVQSAFKTMHLGPTGDSTKITGIIKSKLAIIFNQVNNALDQMIVAWNHLDTTTQAVVKNQLTSFSSSITDLKAKLQIYLNQIGAIFYKDTFYNQIFGALTAYYGLVFALSILGLIGSILVTFCTVIRARLIMYTTCGFLMILGLAGFCFLVYLAFVHPQMNQICAYADKRLISGNSTKELLRNMGYPDYADKIAACMEDGNGKMVDTLNSSFSTSFDMINIIAQGTLRFNDKIPSFTQANFDVPFTSSYSIVSQVKNAEVWQLNDTTAINHINKTFLKNYTLGVTCNSIAVNGDAWMPSFNLFTCPGGKSKIAPCSDLSVQTTCPLGCYQILNQFQSPSGDHSYATTLAQRYDLAGGTNCNYYQYIVNLHDNWNIIRQAKMDTMNGTLNSIKTLVDNYATKTNSVKAGLNSFKTTLQANLDSMTNLTSGSFNGVDCRTIGESIWDLRDAFCIGLVQSTNYNIICLSLICYGILLLSCCVTCTGVRHFKHLQKMQMHVGYKGTPISLSDTRILDK